MRHPFAPKFLVAALCVVLIALAFAQDDFEWLPPGGASLLLEVAEGCDGCGSLADLLTAERTKDEWAAFFEENGVPDLLEEHEISTLSGYLALVAPTDPSNVPTGSSVQADQLPNDGRILTLQQCMICHGIMRPVTQDWPPSEWASHLTSGTHATIGLPEMEVRLISNFLGHNTVPIEEIPEDQRGVTPGY